MIIEIIIRQYFLLNVKEKQHHYLHTDNRIGETKQTIVIRTKFEYFISTIMHCLHKIEMFRLLNVAKIKFKIFKKTMQI